MATRTSDLLTQVQAAHEFDYDALCRYASAHVSGFPVSPSTFTVKQVFLCFFFHSLCTVFICVNFFFLAFVILVWPWTIQPDVFVGSRYRSLPETLRFEEEACWQIAPVCSCRGPRVSGTSFTWSCFIRFDWLVISVILVASCLVPKRKLQKKQES